MIASSPRLGLALSILLTITSAWPLGLAAPAAASTGSGAAVQTAAQASPPPSLEAFQLVAPGRGWVLLDQQLHWTDDGGQQWRELTPTLGQATIVAAHFVDAHTGWLVTVSGLAANAPAYQLYRTTNGGADWQRRDLDLFAPGDPAALPQTVYLDFVDAGTGWLVVRQATSSAFNQGTLFTTYDGGLTWKQLPLPAAGPVQFTSATDGTLETAPPDSGRYVTHDGGATWERLAGTAADAPADAAPAGPTDLSLAAPDSGWGRSANGTCDAAGCRLDVSLVATRDGGQTWQPVTLPGGQTALTRTFLAPAGAADAQAADSQDGLTMTFAGHGFDSCVRPTVEQMQTWFTHSPYRVWNLYLGGSSRFSLCGVLSASYLQSLTQQGWLFIPTWVGPQPPCSQVGRGRKISADLGTAYNEGIIEALMALDVAEALGLTGTDKSGTILYYDIENYPNNADCKAATRSFISGWSATLRAHGTRAGVYGSPCTSYVGDLAGATHVPDAVWLAYWTHAAYDGGIKPSDFVFSVPCISPTLWNNNQRLRQYAGDHTENWGGVALPIDSDVTAGPVVTARGNCSPGPTQVALFVYANFGGACVVRGVGNYPDPNALGFPNDALSSLRVGSDVRLRLCEHSGYDGVCQEFSGAVSGLAGTPVGDNTASSAQVFLQSLNLTPRTWFPVVHRGAPLTAPLPNGSFESGPNLWSTFSQQGLHAIVPSQVLANAGVTPRTGQWAVWLGGVHTETVRLEQTLTIPAHLPVLSYWQWVQSQETGCYYDVASIWVNGNAVEGFGLCTSPPGWVRRWVNLSAYAGSTVTLRFQVYTDSNLTSSLFIDDVEFWSGP